MHIYLDAMGGDHAPKSTVKGALQALREYPQLHIVLGGVVNDIQKELEGREYDKDRLEIDDCPELISNDESPVMAVRRKTNSAIVKGMLSLRDKKVDAFISAGSTGAVLAGAMFRLGRIHGIERPAIAPLMPHGEGFFLLIDCGANVDCRPHHLEQFAYMGEAYMKSVMGIPKPRIGLINNGAEEEKGDELRKQTYPLLKNSSLNFVGNVEARYITANVADVLVCDGFVGNVVLKFMEGLSRQLLGMIKTELMSSPITKLGALLAKPAFGSLKKKLDYKEVGGAPLLGVNGSVIKSHGSSDAKAIFSSFRQAVKMVEADVPGLIKQYIESKEDTVQ